MNTKYHLDALNKSTFGVKYYDACAKPHSDAEKTANSLGFESVYLYGSRISKLGKPLWKKILLHSYNVFYAVCVFLQSLKLRKLKDCDIFVQYGFAIKSMYSIVKMLKHRGNRIIMLIHDLETLRFKEKRTDEIELLKYVDVLIVHTQPMLEKVKEKGFKGKVVVMGFFDYLNDFEADKNEKKKDDIEIVFAGNLSKSLFLQKLNTLEHHEDMYFNLYGTATERIMFDNSVRYKGFFENNNILAIEGNWGLVWDGDSIDGCTTELGDYLRLNAPFKFSLYIAREIPVIVWKESAMAYYVEKFNIGVTVESLSDIYTTIKSLSKDQLKAIRDNVHLLSKRVKQGDMLKQALRETIK